MADRILARWATASGDGVQHLVLRQGQAEIIAEGMVISDRDDPFAVHYRIECDPAWRVRRAEVKIAGNERRLLFVSDGEGRWTGENGAPLADLDGSVDIDLLVTPFTNTLPIRRLDLKAGDSVDIDPVYVSFPGLAVFADPQRYTCLEYGRRYRYESRDSDFVREITTDENGLVVDYPGLFRRIL
jgi:hypothetical protein